MKELLEHVKEVLEQSLNHPDGHKLDHCIQELEEAKARAGEDQEQMFNDLLRAVTQARNAQIQLENARDNSATNAFTEAHRAIEQAIEAYTDPDNDPV
ncbi:hypothetical protein EDD68_104163 [Melghiribacillus thermohalophilus]|uniref:YtzH-like protein n=1 Tax=Melghiribacillus thermohalophilus TaxID=1324956 RepID=A0A4R3N746_9BACI|nr:hypothetical protein [Melghiribacillus thermohalophilus]TCT25088.1 hypothetical protein EDD68_104163 [Melghiribacillus thermohalophilus]